MRPDMNFIHFIRCFERVFSDETGVFRWRWRKGRGPGIDAGKNEGANQGGG